eukprot:c6096_g1_i3.p1 GENE.c6096_g1_i3~~c6096_g1_i3.p1  ORF type:complete len:268 (-),score=51.75 c6096_g1_i3:169-972(-)
MGNVGTKMVVEVELAVVRAGDCVRNHNHHIAHISTSTRKKLNQGNHDNLMLWVKVSSNNSNTNSTRSVLAIALVDDLAEDISISLSPACAAFLCNTQGDSFTVRVCSATSLQKHSSQPVPKAKAIHLTLPQSLNQDLQNELPPHNIIIRSLTRKLDGHLVAPNTSFLSRVGGIVAVVSVSSVLLGNKTPCELGKFSEKDTTFSFSLSPSTNSTAAAATTGGRGGNRGGGDGGQVGVLPDHCRHQDGQGPQRQGGRHIQGLQGAHDGH